MRRILAVVLLTLFQYGIAQKPIDVTGTWFGTANFLKTQSQMRYELVQKKSQITGFLILLNPESGDSLKAKISGIVKGVQVTLDPVELAYRSGGTCMSRVELTYQRNGTKELLGGRWKGDLRLSTCPPLVAGPMTLVKSEKITAVEQVMESNDQSNIPLPEDDQAGELLARELKKRTYHALIIGVDQYQDPDIQDLDHPVNDARDLANVLTSQYSFTDENMTFLTNPTRSEIIASLDRLAEIVTERDNLLIFYAGHGIWNQQLNQGYWLPSDASNTSKAFWISNSTLRDYVRGIASKHTLLISDACFSGGIFKERAIKGSSRALLEVYKLPSRKAITSGTLKTVPDKSVFMQYLLERLSSQETPLLSADQLFRNFKIAVINNSPNGQVPQYGPISQAGDEGGDFIFLKNE